MARPPVRDGEDLDRSILRRLKLVERRLTGGGGSGGVGGVSPGMTAFYTGPGALPPGFLLADGSAVSRATYIDLFNAIGTTYGAGDGSTTFNLPNLKGRVPVGQDTAQTEFDVIGETGGAKTHTLTYAQTPIQRGVRMLWGGGNINFSGNPQASVGAPGGNGLGTFQNDPQYDADAAGGFKTGGQPHNNLQPYMVGRWIIAFAGGSGPSVVMLTNQGSTAQRDAMFGTPSTAAEQVALANRKIMWFNTDLGWEESYYATTGTAGLATRGLIAGTASGWYPTGAGPDIFLQSTGAGQAFNGAADYSAWQAPGSGDSWRNFTGLTYAAPFISTTLPGRYQPYATMYFPPGSGTAVAALQAYQQGGTTNIFNHESPVPLQSAFGQLVRYDASEIVMPANAALRFRLTAGVLTLGSSSRTHIGLRYLGPPLTSL